MTGLETGRPEFQSRQWHRNLYSPSLWGQPSLLFTGIYDLFNGAVTIWGYLHAITSNDRMISEYRAKFTVVGARGNTNVEATINNNKFMLWQYFVFLIIIVT
jgi:hypothetical protein